MPWSTTPDFTGRAHWRTIRSTTSSGCWTSTPSDHSDWPKRWCRGGAAGSGGLVNISSVQGRIGTPLEGAYAASKHALEALSEERLHFELSHFGLRAVIIEPGHIAPGMKHSLTRHGLDVYGELHTEWTATTRS